MKPSQAKHKLERLLLSALREGQALAYPPVKSNHKLLRKMERELLKERNKCQITR